MNKIILTGRLTADPELNTTGTGVEYCDFTLAVDKRVKDGEKTAIFVPCKAWRKTAVFIATYFNKGKPMLIEGNLDISKYTKDDEQRTFTRVVVENVEFIGGKKDETAQPYTPPVQTAAVPTTTVPTATTPSFIDAVENFTEPPATDDDLPF